MTTTQDSKKCLSIIPKTFNDVFGDFGSLGFLSKHDPDRIQMFIMLQIAELNELFAKDEQLNIEEMRRVGTELMDQHRQLNPPDLRLCFKMFAAGKLGEVYGKLSIIKILHAVERYWTLRGNHAEGQRSSSRTQEKRVLGQFDWEKHMESMTRLAKIRKEARIDPSMRHRESAIRYFREQNSPPNEEE